jgi:hypothetical protein
MSRKGIEEHMKIRMKMNVGTFHNIDDVRAGDEVDVPDEEAVRYCSLGYAEPVTKVAERAVAREERVMEKVVAQTEADGVLLTDTVYEHEDVPPHPVSAEAVQPDAIVHDVTPDKGRVTEDNPLQHESPRVSKTTTVPTKRAKPAPR